MTRQLVAVLGRGVVPTAEPIATAAASRKMIAFRPVDLRASSLGSAVHIRKAATSLA